MTKVTRTFNAIDHVLYSAFPFLLWISDVAPFEFAMLFGLGMVLSNVYPERRRIQRGEEE